MGFPSCTPIVKRFSSPLGQKLRDTGLVPRALHTSTWIYRRGAAEVDGSQLAGGSLASLRGSSGGNGVEKMGSKVAQNDQERKKFLLPLLC